MRHPQLVKTTCWFLLVFFPVAMNAMPAVGTVQAQGAVTVNGKPVANTGTLFAGDRIQTGAGSAATLSSQGVVVQMEPNTTTAFNGRSLDVGCGNAMVATSIGTLVRVAGITANPAAQNATRIQVSQVNGTVKITARDNWAVVNDGRIRQTLAPGQTVTFNRPGASCQIPTQALGSSAAKVYLPAAAIVVGLGVVSYCTSNGSFCSQVSPAAP